MVKTTGSSKWAARFMRIAHEVASWSKDPSTKVGAVLVNDMGILSGAGFNGFPRKISDTPERYAERSEKYSLIVHAEANALLNCAASTHGLTLYCTQMPCAECSKLIIQAGIHRVVAAYHGDDQRWMDSVKMLREAELSVLFFNTESEQLWGARAK